MKKKNIAAILAIFFGAFGAHKFYLNKFSAGLIRMLLFFMCIINGYDFGEQILFMVGIVEGILLLISTTEAFNQKYNNNNPIENKRPWGKQTPTVIPKSNPYIKTGNEKYKEFDYPGALEEYTKALTLNPTDKVIHFNMSCAFSQVEDTDKSIYHLSKAVENGYNDLETIKNKDDLAFLRVQPAFQDFLQKYFPDKTSAGNIQTEEERLEMPDLLEQIKILNQKRENGQINDDDYYTERQKLLDT